MIKFVYPSCDVMIIGFKSSKEGGKIYCPLFW